MTVRLSLVLIFSLLVVFGLGACQTVPGGPPSQSKSASTPGSALIKAAAKGHVDAVRDLLAQGVSASTRSNYKSWSALMLASAGAHREVVKLLLDKGAEVNYHAGKDGSTALMLATVKGDPATVKLLLDAGADVHAIDNKLKSTALLRAAFGGREAVATLLLDAGSDINFRGLDGVTALWLAASKGGAPMVRLLVARGADVNLRSYMGSTPLMRAARRGDVEAVTVLLKAGALVYPKDVNGRAAVNYARNVRKKTNDHARVVQILERHGADINGKNRDIDTQLLAAASRGRLAEVRKLVSRGADVNARDPRGFSVLMKAATRSQTAAYLLRQGADPFAIERGRGTVLHHAALHGNLILARDLLARNVPVNAVNRNKETPLCEAVQTGQRRTVEALLKHGADPNIRSKFGTPLMLAIERDNQPMIQLLEKWGAK